MGLLGFIDLISNATSTGVNASTASAWKQSQRAGDGSELEQVGL